MSKAKKASHLITIQMEQGLLDRMEDSCARSGQLKNVAIERALTDYIDAYDRMLKREMKTKTKE